MTDSSSRCAVSSSVGNNSPCGRSAVGPTGGAASVSPAAFGSRARRPRVKSRITLTMAPTPAPYAPASPEPSTISCSGLYTPLEIKFCAICWAASVAPSTPPRASAVVMMFFRGPICGASKSSKPVGAPSCVARRRSSSVAPSASARRRDSPAPADVPRPTLAPRPSKPAPGIKKGAVEPTPSPSLRPTESSYPSAASNGFFAMPAMSLMASRAAFSVSSGNNALIPVPAVSSRPMAPGTMPLPNSTMLPPIVVSISGLRPRISARRWSMS